MTNTSGPYFRLAGLRTGSSTINYGTLGDYWSSTGHSSNNKAYYLYLNASNSNVIATTPDNRAYGLTLRCINTN